MTRTDPALVTVVLSGGPCDGQIINVTPYPGGHMPRVIAACTPAPPRDVTQPPTPADYHSYVRHGGQRSQDYRYWRDQLPARHA